MLDRLNAMLSPPKAKQEKNRINIQAMHDMLDALEPPVAKGYTMPVLHPDVAPESARIAQDSYCSAMQGYTGQDPSFYSGFMGYPALAQLSQSSEYRSVVETTAEEMTREWGEVKGDDEKRVEDIEAELKRYGIRDLMRKQIENDQYFGRSQLFIRIKGQEDNQSLPLLMTSAGVPKDSLLGFTVIDPIWTTPTNYNSTDPTLPTFYVPEKWFVLGKETHRDRLLTLVMRPVPDMMKPAYNFSGVAMTQLMKPYVERFQRTVDSVSDLIHTFSITGLKTDMSNALAGGSMADIVGRVAMFSKFKNNRNMMLTDVSSGEELFQQNTPLTTLDALQEQAHKMLCTPSKTPQVKLLGIVEGGLSTSQDGEIRVYYDHISALQEAHIAPQIETIINLIQLSKFGDIDETIEFKFKPLYQLTAKEQAEVNEIKARTAQTLVDAAIIDGMEARTTLQQDEDNEYQHIDMNKEIESYALDPNNESGSEFTNEKDGVGY